MTVALLGEDSCGRLILGEARRVQSTRLARLRRAAAALRAAGASPPLRGTKY